MNDIALVWFRQDLRVSDNPALSYALKHHKQVIPIYIYDENIGEAWKIGSASKWWLHYSLAHLGKKIPLIILKGDSDQILYEIVAYIKPEAVYWNRCYEPFFIKRDKLIKSDLISNDIIVKSFNGSLLFEPGEIKNSSDNYFKVYSHFWKACLKKGVDRYPLPNHKLKAHDFNHLSIGVDQLGLLPKNPNWALNFEKIWAPGEEGAIKQLNHFIKNNIKNYAKGRNILKKSYTSRLSPHLHFGEISPLQVWDKIKGLQNYNSNHSRFLGEIGWREFNYHLLYNFPKLADENFKSNFNKFSWENNESHLNAWKKGLTGYPIVDAGMRQLWQTGYMHNRVRMIVASFLIKDLLIDWREGAKWFWDTLLDADLANNAANWQWVAGSGADAAPYFRIFNPILQSKKFDFDGIYIRTWLPELSKLPNKLIHTPWLVEESILYECNIKLGKTYPMPIINHEFARKIALELYKKIKSV